MKVLSAKDILLADELAGLNQFDICSLEHIDKVYGVLAKLGYDTEKPIHIYAAQHRRLGGQVEIGYVFAGELNLKREYIKGPYSQPEDFMIAASHQDRSLFDELYNMGHTVPAYGGDGALDSAIPSKEDTEYREEELRIANTICQLEDLLLHIRGSQIKSDGSCKTYADYKTPETVEKQKGRRRSKKQQQGITDD